MGRAAKKKPSADHVVMDGREFFCTHCGARHSPWKGDKGIEIKAFARAADAFTVLHANCVKDPAVEQREEQRRLDATKSPEAWINGPDTGISSATIWQIATGWDAPRYATFGPDVPHDPADFGRCYRLLQAFPWMRDKLSSVAACVPKWGPMVREWDRLTALYEEELPTGEAPKLHALLHQLEGEGYEAIGQRNPYKRES